MSSEILTLVGVILLLILASAFFSSAETALTAASDARMRQLSRKRQQAGPPCRAPS